MLGAATSYGPMPSARGLVWRRHRWLACLGGANGVHILGEIRPGGGLIPWPNRDGRT